MSDDANLRAYEEADYFSAIAPYQEEAAILGQEIAALEDELTKKQEYISKLEEFVRAVLWSENLIMNDGVVPWSHGDPFKEHNHRVFRYRLAQNNLGAELWDEVVAEDVIIYNGIGGDNLPAEELDAAWKLLEDRGLVTGEPMEHLTSRGRAYTK